ncbi:hypothetical protein RhiirA5_417547 [Rhizophagus irregularis]|uniref:Uncharacterized protein n=1 Tax=Rhizophagus irregularis TaxID=588596 RepID=A0A2I1EPR2_9GLOM|nr:hypothetical protein RhiirA5_417547 [Rhizophagus irregularis]PKY24104.1 hypothetical protein RhiirB3_438538 [Rhizophagus irregularis]
MKEKFESHCQLKKCQFILFGILDLQYTEIIDTEETHKVEDEAEADKELQESEKRRGRRNRRRRRRRKLL